VQAVIPSRRRALASACLALAAAGCATAGDPAGRWEGIADVPGRPLRVVVDLDRDAHGAWQGSVILPDRGVKGAPAEALAVAGCDVSFGLAGAFPGGDVLQPGLALACRADGSLSGSFALGGQRAPVRLRRVGAAQVDRAPANSVLDAALIGRWTGRYELGGVPRDVTLTLANGSDGTGAGQLVIVGKRTTTLAVTGIVQGREFVTLRAAAADFRIEGRFSPDPDVIDGMMAQGPFEAPLVLRRQAAGEKAS
jgi:hypothetical protein